MQGSRDSIAAVFCCSVSLLLSACASPVEGWRPPSPDSVAHTIYVSLDTWHAVIALPVQPAGYDQPSPFSFEKGTSPQHSLRSTPHFYEEWGYAERAWYVEGRRGLTGMLRALFWPTEGVVEVGQHEQVWAERTPQPPSDLFIFRVSDEGVRRLRRHLRSTVASNTPVASFDQSTFYPAVRSYHVLHTCHQYAASALREAGLPISAFWAFNRTSLAWQLQRAARMAAEQTGHALPVKVQ